MEWENLSTNALDVMKNLGNFTPTVNAAERSVKGYTQDDEDGGRAYWESDYLRSVAAGCIEVADWLDKRDAAQPKTF